MWKVVTPLNSTNKTQNFYPADDKWEMQLYPMKASTAMAAWIAIIPETSWADVTGYFTAMGTVVENAAWDDFEGILAEPIAATDDDYATAWKLKWVWKPKTPNAKAYFTVWAWTFTAADVGKRVEVHSDWVSLAVDTVWKWATITDYISSSRWKCRFDLPKTETA